jgi:hypothetical protein
MLTLAAWVRNDRERLVALQPADFITGGKFFFAPKLFTVNCGELILRALLAAG